MEFEAERVGDRSLRVAGEIDMDSAPLLEVTLRLLLGGGGDIALDMADVTFMDSSGLHCLLRAARAMAGQGLLLIDRPSRQVLRTLEVSGVLWARTGVVVRTEVDSAYDGPGAVYVLAALIDRAVEAAAVSTVLIRRSVRLVGAAQRIRAASTERRLAWASA